MFSDQAATSITAGTSPFTGTFKPEGLLNALNGKPTRGTWTIYVNDDTTTNTGSLSSWGLTLTYY